MANQSASADLDLFSLSLHDDQAFREVRPEGVGKPVSHSVSGPELEQDPPQQSSSAEAASQSDAAAVLQSDGATSGVDQEARPASAGMSRDSSTRPSPPPKRGGRKKRETAPPIPAPLRCDPTSPVRFLNVHGVAARYGVSVPTIWRWLKNGMGLPAPIHLSNGTTRWRIADLDAFDDALAPKPSDTIGEDSAVSSTGGGVSMPGRRR
jgi:predicted DNA-binding transcriptional regulator AlpA